MRKTILSVLLVLGLQTTQAEGYEYLWLYSPTDSDTSSYALDDIRKITFGGDALQVHLNSRPSPVLCAYANLLKLTFEDKPDPTAVDNLSAVTSGLSVTHTLSGIRAESPSPLKSVAVYNLQGSRVALFGRGMTAVSYSMSALPSGVYVIRAENSEETQSIKFIKH